MSHWWQLIQAFNKHLHRLCMTLLCINISACSHTRAVHLYDGPQLPEQQLAELRLPSQFELVKWNQQPINTHSQLFRNRLTTVYLPPGRHTLQVRYAQVWRIGADQHEKIQSAPILFQLHTQKGEILKFAHPAIRLHAEALQFSTSPKLSLVSAQQNVQGIPQLAPKTLSFLNRESSDEIANPHFEQLKYWWQQSPVQERQLFTNWIKQGRAAEPSAPLSDQ